MLIRTILPVVFLIGMLLASGCTADSSVSATDGSGGGGGGGGTGSTCQGTVSAPMEIQDDNTHYGTVCGSGSSYYTFQHMNSYTANVTLMGYSVNLDMAVTDSGGNTYTSSGTGSYEWINIAESYGQWAKVEVINTTGTDDTFSLTIN